MSRLDRPEWQLPSSSSLTESLGLLRAALLTTFDPPSPDVLVEDVLPLWLGVTRELVDSGPARTTFLVELQQRVKALRGKITVFASGGTIQPHWLWRDVHVCQVGSAGKAVQHAKLWLLHRGPDPDTDTDESLEVVVSSTNLTRSALQGQIQAGWRVVIPLGKAGGNNRRSWGILPEFLKELGRHSGQKGGAAVQYWIEDVLPRARCPDVTFIASVPGRHTSATLRRAESAWGVAGLRQLRPIAKTRRVDLITPCVGTFDAGGLSQWATQAGTSVGRLSVAWIPKGHAWGKRGWSMPTETAAALRETDVTVMAFPDPEEAREAFHEEWDRTLIAGSTASSIGSRTRIAGGYS